MSASGADLIIVATSARAAAHAAARAGLRPYWLDACGDVDLRGRFPGLCIDGFDAVDAVTDAFAAAPVAPWLYGAPLENRHALVDRLAALRPLAGNPGAICARVRDPWQVAAALRAAGLDVPRLAHRVGPGRWLHKRRDSTGGGGVRLATPGEVVDGAGAALQEAIDGEAVAGLYVADGRTARIVGVTAQLLCGGGPGPGPFAYRGTLGPLPVPADEAAQWTAIGAALAGTFALRGLFGVDAIRRDGRILVVEVNPRWTAAAEVLERAGAAPLLAAHLAACGGVLPAAGPAPATRVHGKAYVFAPRDLLTPGPDVLAAAADGEAADLPAASSRVPASAPLLTVFASAPDVRACAALLDARTRAALAACSQA